MTLGQGQFGKLRLARDIDTKQFAAVKKVKGAKEIAMSRDEANMQKKLDGLSNIMPILDTFDTCGADDKPVLYHFMPLAGFGNGDTLAAGLAMLDKQRAALKEQVLVHIARGLLTGKPKTVLIHVLTYSKV